MVLYCDFEASQSSTMGVDLPGVAAKHNVTGFCIKPVTRSELPQLDTITYSGENAIEKFFEEITKFSYHMNEMYEEYGQEKMIYLDRKSQEYRNHWKAKKCWICKEEITCKASKLIFAHLKILKKKFAPQRLENLWILVIPLELRRMMMMMMTVVKMLP